MNREYVKMLLEYYLIKKNNFSINDNDIILINELKSIYLESSGNLSKFMFLDECNCALINKTIAIEVSNNKCLDCGLPLIKNSINL